MKSACAFSPGNITCFFAIVPNKNPLKKGSLGVSFATNKGATVTAKKSSKFKIIINGTKKNFPTVQTALKMLFNRNTKNEFVLIIKTDLPIGYGYGMSGACTLASIYAVNELFKLRRTKQELGLIAHKAEVINNTGLGSVTAEYLGGLLIRNKKGHPLFAKKIDIKQNSMYYKSFGPIDTKKIITNDIMKQKINKFGLESIHKIQKLKKIRLSDLISEAKSFSEKTGLIRNTKVKKLIDNIEKNGGYASMNMLGNSVFSNIQFKGCNKIKISTKGARLL